MADQPPLEKPFRPRPLLEALIRHGVDFVVVGGLAGTAHGSSYPTFDLDVAYARDSENIKRLVRALRELAVTLRGAPPDLPFQLEERTIENGANFTFDTEHGSFDVLAAIDGIRSYEELRDAAIVGRLEGVEVRYASLDHLISMKRASNRTKDKLMLEDYIVIADEQQRETGG
jgi:hypothetical protein